MTTPTTPAADAVSAIQALIDDEAQYLCVVVAKTHLALLLSEIAAANARESALIAERDAIRAAARQFYNLTIADPDVLIRAFTESKREAIIETGRVLAAALAAPAVEG